MDFDSAEFNLFLPEDAMSDRNCVAWTQLPEYEIASFRTGRYIPGEEGLWSGGYDFLLAERHQAIYDMAQTSEPVIRSKFNMHLGQNTLFYIKEQCEPEDVEAKFMLHIAPVDVNDLPEERRQFGFDNLDFDFAQHGGRLNRNCAAQIQLPEYDIASVRTGQFIHGEPEPLWSGSYDIQQE